MKTLEYVKNNIVEFERDDFLDKRFTCRFLDFIEESEWEKFGFKRTGDFEKQHKPKAWTEENILSQLKSDVDFGIEKALDHRGISSELMAMVCLAWLDVLEDKDIDRNLYGWYGSELFKAIDKKYGFGLVDEETLSEIIVIKDLDRWMDSPDTELTLDTVSYAWEYLKSYHNLLKLAPSLVTKVEQNTKKGKRSDENA